MRQSFIILFATAVIAAAADAQQATKVVVASDEGSQITVPSGWNTLDLNKQAEIQVGNEEDDAYLIVLNESKEDLDGWNLEKHSRVTLGQFLSSLSLPSVTGPKALTIDGHPAVQYEVRGAAEGRKFIYLHTTVDGEKLFSQILAWTVPSRAAEMKPQLVQAINSFHEKK